MLGSIISINKELKINGNKIKGIRGICVCNTEGEAIDHK